MDPAYVTLAIRMQGITMDGKTSVKESECTTSRDIFGRVEVTEVGEEFIIG